jgi:spore germination protein (amino acid permease)
MLAIYIHVAQILFLPGPISKICGQDAWLAILIGGGLGTLSGLLVVWICARHPGQGPAQIARSLMGKWAGSLVGLVYAAFMTWIFSLVLRDILDFVVMVILPGTPGRVIVSMFAAVALYAAWDGLEPIARVSFQVLVAIVAPVALLPLMQVREFRLLQVDPFLYHGFGSVLRGAVIALPWFGESVGLLSLLSHVKHPQKTYGWVVVGMAGGTLLLTVLVALTVFIFGPDLPGRYIFPIYYMIQMISIAKIVERIEVVLVTVWLSGMWLKASFYLFAASESAAHSLGLKHHRWPAVVLAVGGVILSQVWTSTLDLIYWNTTPGAVVSLMAVEYGLPLLLAAATLARALLQRQRPAHA